MSLTLCRKRYVWQVVSRSCDIDKLARKHFLVAPIVHIKDLKEDQRTEEKLQVTSRANEIFFIGSTCPRKVPNLTRILLLDLS